MASSVPNSAADPRHRPILVERLRRLLATLLTEGLAPSRAAAAVFVGVFVGIIPIYGFQSLAAIALAMILRLNKPLTFAATFVNNPLLQPFLVFGSVGLGQFVLTGSLAPFAFGHITRSEVQAQLSAWLVGSVALGALLGGLAASATFLFLRLRSPGARPDRDRSREYMSFVNLLFVSCPPFDRRFVKWKMRLDRIFDFLGSQDLGRGPAVDLGCGYGIALGLAAFQHRGRRLIGCDLEARRIQAAAKALQRWNAELSVGDVRTFELPEAGLVLIIDVLQYLNPQEQRALLQRCCSTLAPGGKLIFRVPDRERGLTSGLSLAFDRLIFLLSGNGRRPTVLSTAEYRQVLRDAGMETAEHPFRNRLPLAHILFTAEKPAVSASGK